MERVRGAVSEYVVDIKPSARRASPDVGRYVRDHGGRRAFADRSAADGWAAKLSADGGKVWVRDANPDDATGADGYLMAYGHEPTPAEDPDPGEQGGLERFGVAVVDDGAEPTQLPLERFDLD